MQPQSEVDDLLAAQQIEQARQYLYKNQTENFQKFQKQMGLHEERKIIPAPYPEEYALALERILKLECKNQGMFSLLKRIINHPYYVSSNSTLGYALRLWSQRNEI
jgi:hypothetical protein